MRVTTRDILHQHVCYRCLAAVANVLVLYLMRQYAMPHEFAEAALTVPQQAEMLRRKVLEGHDPVGYCAINTLVDAKDVAERVSGAFDQASDREG